MCSCAAPVGFRAETLQDTKSIFTMHTGKGVRVVGSLQQWWNQSISTFEDCRTLSGPKELLKTIIELSLTKDIYLTLIKDMYWSKWLLFSYSCFSWDSIYSLKHFFMQHSATCHLSLSIFFRKNKAQGEHKHKYKGQILSQLKHE